MTGGSDRFTAVRQTGGGERPPASADFPRLMLFGREWIVVSYRWSADIPSPVSSDQSVVLDLCLRAPGSGRLKTTRVKRASLIESIIEQIEADPQFPTIP